MKFLGKLKSMRKVFGGASMDEVLEACHGMGIDVTMEPIVAEAKPATAELEAIATAAIEQGSKLYKLEWKSDGYTAVAFVVLRSSV
jgi:hypothetical protein